MNITIYHNPRCSKSRETLHLLTERGIKPVIIDYLKTPPSAEQLNELLYLLNKEPRELMRTKEAEYQAQGLADMSLSRDALINALISYPILMERPIVIANGKAAIGRPPEAVLAIL